MGKLIVGLVLLFLILYGLDLMRQDVVSQSGPDSFEANAMTVLPYLFFAVVVGGAVRAFRKAKNADKDRGKGDEE